MKALCLIVPFTLLLFLKASAQVRLPQLVRDSMILQRDAPLTFWGWATAGERVTVTIGKKKYSTTTGKDGRWRLRAAPMKAGGPYTIDIVGSNKITLKDVLVGDVWVCAGQSNMVHQMELHSVRYEGDITSANYPAIREFWVPNTADVMAPQEDLPGGFWKWANPSDVRQFSAVAYFFARQLYNKYKVPIGLINASWGGTPIEAWTSEEGLNGFPAVASTINKNKDTAYVGAINRIPPPPPRPVYPALDKGMQEQWSHPTYKPVNWQVITVPGYWEDQGVRNFDGVMWYRKEIDVPASMLNGPTKIFLGRIVDADEVYLNGTKIGNKTYMYPQRRYAVPDGLLKEGKNLLAVRVTNNGGKGGFVPDKPYQLIGSGDTIALGGEWSYKVGQVFLPVNRTAVQRGRFEPQNEPTGLYNSMIAPLTNYAVKGFLWYQGETNSSRPAEYASLQPAMINDWRTKWNQPAAPFLFVQLPNFGDMTYVPSESQWAEFRESQKKSLALPNTAMAVAIDVGEWNDIHPDRKKEVGERLAIAAEKIAYGDERIVSSGPLYKSALTDGNKIIISFTHTGSGLVTRDGTALNEFAIAGSDRKFVWANAKIEGDKVIVWSDDIPQPMFVRYAWADSPVNPNLYNKEGLPASPFQTP